MKIVKRPSAFPSMFNDDFDNLFQGFFRPVMPSEMLTKGQHLPAVDIDESDKGYLLLADMPGFNKDEVHVSFDDGQLIIKAEHKEESEKKQKGGNVLKERRYGSYFRSFNFGKGIAEHDISAKYENGVLELNIPKAPVEEQKARKISVN